MAQACGAGVGLADVTVGLKRPLIRDEADWQGLLPWVDQQPAPEESEE
jgi:hypothetical protein